MQIRITFHWHSMQAVTWHSQLPVADMRAAAWLSSCCPTLPLLYLEEMSGCIVISKGGNQ